MNGQEPQTSATSKESVFRCLIVTMGGRLFALDAGAVQRVLTLEESGQSGYPVVQGVIYRTSDVVSRLACSQDGDGALVRVVLLSEHGRHGSVRVSEVHGFMELQWAQVLPLPLQFCGSERGWYRGMILVKQSVALVLNTGWVLQGTVGCETSVVQSGHSASGQVVPELTSGESRSC
jgi:chemotaxis signal transduction protein